jgi:transcriptional regulator with XRE-family HTH domain
MSIGQRIKQRRTELGWSQRDLAEKMGYNNNSTVARIENGKVDIPQSRIIKFGEVLGVSIGYLMGWEEDIKKDPVGMVERHFEIIMDEDISDIFDDFKTLDPTQKKLVKDLVHSLAETKKRKSNDFRTAF